jgi:hypothetical protein
MVSGFELAGNRAEASLPQTRSGVARVADNSPPAGLKNPAIVPIRQVSPDHSYCVQCAGKSRNPVDSLTNSIAASSIDNAASGVQQSVGISLLKKGQENDAATMARILNSVPAPVQAPSPAGVGTLVDVNA